MILWLGKAGFSWGFFWSVPIGILVSQLLQYPDWDIWGKNKKPKPGTHHHVVFQDSRSLVCLPSFLYLSESPYICLIYNVQEYSGVLSGWNRAKYNYSIFLKAEVLSESCFKMPFHGVIRFWSVTSWAAMVRGECDRGECGVVFQSLGVPPYDFIEQLHFCWFYILGFHLRSQG